MQVLAYYFQRVFKQISRIRQCLYNNNYYKVGKAAGWNLGSNLSWLWKYSTHWIPQIVKLCGLGQPEVTSISFQRHVYNL